MDSLRPGFKTPWITCGVTMGLFNLLIRWGDDRFSPLIGIFFGIAMAAGVIRQSRLQLRIAAWLVLPLFVWLFYLVRHGSWWLLGLQITSALAMFVAIRWMYEFLPENRAKEEEPLNTLESDGADSREK
ncbi:MAG: hypothetical protein QM755_04290 [Luteolibacter sp.]